MECENALIDTLFITSDSAYTYALIGKIVYTTEDSTNYYVLFDSSEDISQPGITIDYIDTTTGGLGVGFPRTISGFLEPSSILGTSKNMFRNTGGTVPYLFATTGYPWFNLYNFTTNLESPYITYKNIQIPSDYVLYNEVIFRRRGSLYLKTI